MSEKLLINCSDSHLNFSFILYDSITVLLVLNQVLVLNPNLILTHSTFAQIHSNLNWFDIDLTLYFFFLFIHWLSNGFKQSLVRIFVNNWILSFMFVCCSFVCSNFHQITTTNNVQLTNLIIQFINTIVWMVYVLLDLAVIETNTNTTLKVSPNNKLSFRWYCFWLLYFV